MVRRRFFRKKKGGTDVGNFFRKFKPKKIPSPIKKGGGIPAPSKPFRGFNPPTPSLGSINKNRGKVNLRPPASRSGGSSRGRSRGGSIPAPSKPFRGFNPPTPSLGSINKNRGKVNLRPQIPQIKNKQIINNFRNRNINRNLKRINAIKFNGLKIADFVSGGSISSNRINKATDELGGKITTFNKRFGGGLNESEFNIAQIERKKILNEQKRIKIKRIKLNKTFKRKFIGGQILGIGESSIKGKIAKKSISEKNIKNIKKEIKQLQKRLSKTKSNTNKKRLKFLIKGKKNELIKRQSGISQKLFAGNPPPLIPAGINIPKNTRVIFGGTTKRNGNIQVSKILFNEIKSSGKDINIGRADVYSISKGKKSFSVTVGKIFAKGSRREKDFVGVKGGNSFERKLIEKTIVGIGKKNKNIGIAEIKKTLDGIKLQTSGNTGRIAVQEVKRFVKFPSAKLRSKITFNVKDFGSIARSLTKKDINLIVGRTLTKEKDIVDFGGIIKQITSKGDNIKLSGTRLKQFQKAIQQTSSVFSSALTKAKTISKVIPKSSTNSIAVNIIKNTAVTKPKTIITNRNLIIPKLKSIKTIQKIKPIIQKIKPTIKTKTIVKLLSSSRSSIKNKTKSVQKRIIKEKQKMKQIKKINSNTKNKQNQRSRVRLSQLQKQLQILKTIQASPTIVSPTIIPIKVINKFKIKKKKRKIKKKKRKIMIGYNVFIKTRGKVKKFNKIPLSKISAKNRLAYILDNSTAVTGSIRKVGKVKKIGKITSKEYGARKRIKARKYKIVKGRRVSLKNKIIERKGRPRINTRGEKRGLSASKILKRIRKKPIRRRKRVKKKK